MSVFDLIASEPLDSKTFTRGKAIIDQNYGIEYPPEKMALLFDMMKEDGWTAERFNSTLKWFLRNKKYPSWTISDWFDYNVKLYPYSWYLAEVNKNGGGVNKQIEVYIIEEGVYGYKYMDGETPPFPHRKIGEKEWIS